MSHMSVAIEPVELPEPTTVGIRELKQNASAVVARAARGEALIVTDRGRPVARLLPLERKGRIQEMIDAGKIIMPEHSIQDFIKEHSVNGKYVQPITLTGGGPTIGEVLDEMREERF